MKHYNGCLYEKCHSCQCHYCFDFTCYMQKRSPKDNHLETCEDCRACGDSYEEGGRYCIDDGCEFYIGPDWGLIKQFLKVEAIKEFGK